MSTVSKLDAKFWQQHADRYPSDPADVANENPFALPPGFEEEERQQLQKARRRSLVLRMSDAIERAAMATLYVMMVMCSSASLIMLGLFGYVLFAGWFTITEIMQAMA